MDFGLTPEENVLKEVREEYGCLGEIQERLPFLNIFREQNNEKTHWLILPFFIRVNPSEVKLNEPEKIDEIGWFKLDGFPEPLHSGLKLGLERFREYFEKYGRID